LVWFWSLEVNWWKFSFFSFEGEWGGLGLYDFEVFKDFRVPYLLDCSGLEVGLLSLKVFPLFICPGL
jgi:hypothetical protein